MHGIVDIAQESVAEVLRCGIHATLPPPDPDFFYSTTTLSTDGWKDLEWWYEAPHLDICATARSRDACTLSVNWGDGSDTGTGGTHLPTLQDKPSSPGPKVHRLPF